MKRPAVFFDRDNTLIVSDGYLGDPAKVVLMEGAAAAVARVRSLGYATVVVSNQSGVARGMFDEDAVRAVNARLDALLAADNPGAIIDRHDFCPFHPEAEVEKYRRESDLRKPGAGMILRAAEAMALDLERSWLVGDAPRDIDAGRTAGCRTILLVNEQVAASPAALAAGAMAADYSVASLEEAADVIEEQAAARPAGQISPQRATGTGMKLATDAGPVKPAAAGPGAKAAAGAPGAAPVAAPAAARVPAKPAPAAVAPKPPAGPTRLEQIAEQILLELRRRNEQVHTDFSVSKLMAGIIQVIVLATLILGYLQARKDPVWLQIYLTVAMTLQTMTVALLIMSRQK